MSFSSRPIPIFPLPNCVVLPGALQGLHIFEPRYRKMIEDELGQSGQRWIAMALLREGYEPLYCTNRAPIYPTLCVGEIIKHERLPDGRFNLLLMGRERVTIQEELTDKAFRRGLLTRIALSVPEPTNAHERRMQLIQACKTRHPDLGELACRISQQHERLCAFVDDLAYQALPPEMVCVKQMILEEPCLPSRIEILLNYFDTQPETTCWPPGGTNN